MLLSAILLLGVLPVSPSAIAWAEEHPAVEEAVIPPVKDLPETTPAETSPAEETPKNDAAIPPEDKTSADELPTEDTSENDTLTEITAEDEAEPLLYTADSGKCGDNVRWSISGTTLTISGTGAMWDYTDSPWYGRDIKDVVVKSGVTSVGECAFADCWNLQRVSLPRSITTIQYGAFYYCHSLQAISIPSTVERIGERAFQLCGALSSVSLPDSITTVEPYAFSNCWNLQTVTMPKNLHTIGSGAFSYCNALSSISLPESVTDIAYFAFGWCGGLSSVKMPERLNSLGKAAFYNCYNLRSIDIPQGLTALPVGVFQNSGLQSVTIPEGITRIGDSAFSSCESLTSCHLPNSLTVIDDCAFKFCRNLQNIAFPSKLQTVGNAAFYCSGLTSITLPSSLYALGSYVFANTYISYAWIPANLKNHDGTAFRYCQELSAIYVSSYNSEYTSANGVLFDKSGTTLFQYPCAKSGSFYDVPSGVTTIADSAFESTRYLHGVMIPVGVNSIGRWAFSNCEVLETISIPKSITNWGSYAFFDCRNLKQVLLEDGLTSIGEYAFSSTGISQISLPASVSTIESGAFYGTALTSLTLPEGVVRLGEYAFAYCDSLATVSLPQSLIYIGPEAFSGCYTLETANYAGTYQQWQNKVYVSSNNNCLTNVLQYADSLRLSDDLAQMEGATLTLRTADEKKTVGESKITHGRVSLVAIADGNYSVTLLRKGYVSDVVMAAVEDNVISLSEELTMIRRGNVNGVNDVDIIDVQCLYEYLATRVPKGAFKNNPALLRQVGDVNEDGILNILDFEALYQQVVASSGGSSGTSTYKVAMICDASINDGGWGANAYSALVKAAESNGWYFDVTDSVSQSQYYSAIKKYCALGYNLIYLPGNQYTDAALQAAEEYPNIAFVLLNGSEQVPFMAKNGNVSSLQPDPKQIGWIAGALAGLMTKSGKVAFIAAMELDTTKEKILGFKEAAEFVGKQEGKTVELLSVPYANSFSDTAKGTEFATELILQGADVFFGDASSLDSGAREAIDAANAASGSVKIYDIAQPIDILGQNECIICSQITDNSAMIMVAMQTVEAGNFNGSTIYGTLKNGALSVGKFSALVPAEVQRKYNAYLTQMANGTFMQGDMGSFI